MLDFYFFDEGFGELLSWYGKPPIPSIIEQYYESLNCLSNEQFDSAKNKAMSICSFMPTPKELLGFVFGTSEEILEELKSLSATLSFYRYDSHYKLRVSEFKAKLSPVALAFLENKLHGQILEIGDMDTEKLASVKKNIDTFLNILVPNPQLQKNILAPLITNND